MTELTDRRFTHTLLWITVLFFALPYPSSAQSKFTVRDWKRLDAPAKLNVMRVFIERAKEDKIILRLPAQYYVNEIDSMVANAFRNNDLEGLSTSLGVVIHTIAAMEGD